jgi:hypothetical protein
MLLVRSNYNMNEKSTFAFSWTTDAFNLIYFIGLNLMYEVNSELESLHVYSADDPAT